MTGLSYLKVKYLLYISVSIDDVVQKTTALILPFCFSIKRRTVPKQKKKQNKNEDKMLNFLYFSFFLFLFFSFFVKKNVKFEFQQNPSFNGKLLWQHVNKLIKYTAVCLTNTNIDF